MLRIIPGIKIENVFDHCLQRKRVGIPKVVGNTILLRYNEVRKAPFQDTIAVVTMKHIKDVGRQIAREFHPQRVVLFGSHASGNADTDSDVDLLVVMPFRGKAAAKSAEIRLKIIAPFPVDLLVRTPQAVRRRLKMGDRFMRHIIERGKVLYEAPDG